MESLFGHCSSPTEFKTCQAIGGEFRVLVAKDSLPVLTPNSFIDCFGPVVSQFLGRPGLVDRLFSKIPDGFRCLLSGRFSLFSFLLPILCLGTGAKSQQGNEQRRNSQSTNSPGNHDEPLPMSNVRSRFGGTTARAICSRFHRSRFCLQYFYVPASSSRLQKAFIASGMSFRTNEFRSLSNSARYSG